MRDRLIGRTIIVVSVILLWLTRETFIEGWYLLTEKPDWKPMNEYFAIIGEGILYLTTFILAIVFGYSMTVGQDKKQLRVKGTIFLTAAILLIVLELPFYPCDAFNLIRHSFWYSHRTHFH